MITTLKPGDDVRVRGHKGTIVATTPFPTRDGPFFLCSVKLPFRCTVYITADELEPANPGAVCS